MGAKSKGTGLFMLAGCFVSSCMMIAFATHSTGIRAITWGANEKALSSAITKYGVTDNPGRVMQIAVCEKAGAPATLALGFANWGAPGSAPDHYKLSYIPVSGRLGMVLDYPESEGKSFWPSFIYAGAPEGEAPFQLSCERFGGTPAPLATALHDAVVKRAEVVPIPLTGREPLSLTTSIQDETTYSQVFDGLSTQEQESLDRAMREMVASLSPRSFMTFASAASPKGRFASIAISQDAHLRLNWYTAPGQVSVTLKSWNGPVPAEPRP